MARSFTTRSKERADPFVFDVDDRKMLFTPPPPDILVLAGADAASPDPEKQVRALATMLDWLGAGLSDADGDWILARLRDPNDDFSTEDALGVVMGLLEEITARPTQPPSGSSGSPPAPSSTDGRPVAASTPLTSPPAAFAT